MVFGWVTFASGLEVPARHEHSLKSCDGVLQADEHGLRFTPSQASRKDHVYDWKWQDVQRLAVSPSRLEVLTYQDVRWRLGADRSQIFRAKSEGDFEAIYNLLKDTLDQRLVAKLADASVITLRQIPVKRLGRIEGSEGWLKIGADRIVYESSKHSQSMTWRYKDIQNINSAGSLRLSLTTAQQDFHFQLKQELGDAEYDDLWRRVLGAQGLRVFGAKPSER